MKVSGFTIVRNALKFDYPIVEAISSILPLCDEVVVAVGRSDDDTLGLVRSINSPKVRIIETVWDDGLRLGGKVLADETDKAFRAISADSDWAFYIQGDEVVHESSYPAIREAMQRWKDDKKVEGLLFGYNHFYGSYDYVGDSRRWYRNEVRIVRNDKSIHSWRDAQGFRRNGQKLNVKPVAAQVHHYGWVKPPSAQQAKQQSFHKMWHDDEWMRKNVPAVEEFDYSAIDSLKKFEGSHPEVMKARIAKKNWTFTFDPTRKKFPIRQRLLYLIEKLTGWRPGEYKNYRLLS